MATPAKPAMVALPPVVPGVSGMQGTGHLPADERTSLRAARGERRKAADELAVKEEAARNRGGKPAVEAPPRMHVDAEPVHHVPTRGHK